MFISFRANFIFMSELDDEHLYGNTFNFYIGTSGNSKLNYVLHVGPCLYLTLQTYPSTVHLMLLTLLLPLSSCVQFVKMMMIHDRFGCWTRWLE